jgi:serine/threonine protein kinase
METRGTKITMATIIKHADQNNPAPNIEQSQDETLPTSTFDGSNNAADLAPGFVVDNTYEVLALIGGGGMGKVYRARHIILQKEYALKVLSMDQVTDLVWRRFQIEAQAIGRMNHANIVGISNLGLHQGYLPYYVMDLLQGRTLLEILERRGTLSLKEGLPIFIEACAGIGYAHKKGIVHRDIKPGNLFILDTKDVNGNLKIVDFGIAKLSGIKDVCSQQLTHAGEICGSPLYMSPEQCQCGHIDTRSDVYSLGCTLFETLTGSPPLQGKSGIETILMHQNTAPPTLRAAARGKHFPPMLESIVATMLAKAAMDRYQNMELLAHDLSAVLSGQDMPINAFGTAQTITPAQPGLDSIESEKEIRPIDRSLLKKALVTFGATAILLTVTGVWCSAINQPGKIQNGKPGRIKAVDTATAFAGPAIVGGVGEDVFREFSPYSGDAPEEGGQAVSPGDERPFSRDEVKDGKVYRSFQFPKELSIGLLRHDTVGTFNSMCQGQFEKAPDEKLIFIPSQQAALFPQYLTRFRPGDIYGIAFMPQILDDGTLSACAKIPDVRKLAIENCPNLTIKSLPTLYKFKSLEEFYYRNGPFTIQDIINMPRFKNLKVLAFGGQTVTPLLIAARQANSLERIDLMDSPLHQEDFEIISSMTNLQILRINNADITNAEITQLARLPHLKSLYIRNCTILPDALPQFRNLKTLQILDLSIQRLSAKQRRDLRAGLPGVMLQ